MLKQRGNEPRTSGDVRGDRVGTRGGDGLELDPGLLDEDDIKIGCCNHGGSSTGRGRYATMIPSICSEIC